MKLNNKTEVTFFGLIIFFVVGVTFGVIGLLNAVTNVDLGTADNFAILAGSTVTNTGASVVTGDLGLSPGTSVTGFPPGTLDGTQYIADDVATQAKSDLITAYNVAAGQTPVTTVATELGGTTKTAGIYNSTDGTFGITGTLTLNAENNPDAVFIFKTTSTLITASSSVVSLINGAQACHVFWQVGSSATLGTDSTFIGNILALESITLTTGADVEGRVLARNAAVTLDTNIITRAVCITNTNTNTNSNTNTNTNTNINTNVNTNTNSNTNTNTNINTNVNTNTNINTNVNSNTNSNANTNTNTNINTNVNSNTNSTVNRNTNTNTNTNTVISPKFPNTGSTPNGKNIQWLISIVAFITASVLFYIFRKKSAI